MDRKELLERFDTLFAGRRDCYAEGFPKPGNPNKYAFVPARDASGRDVPLTRDLLWRHLKGEICIGIYPILPDNTVHWFACDYDGATWAEAYEGAREQIARLEAAGLHVYLERSRSGNGVHLWSWFDAPIPAALVRQAFLPLLDTQHVAYDRIYPVQDELTGKGYGNLICLPFYGKTVPEGNSTFLDAAGQPIRPQEFLTQSPERNAAPVLEHIAKKHPKARLGAAAATRSSIEGAAASAGETLPKNYGPPVTGALKVISQYGCTFMHHCFKNSDTLREPEWNAMLQVCTHFEHGRDLAHLMSAGSRYNAKAVDQYYDRKLQNDRIGCAYIHEHWPHLACKTCPMKAPHHLAKKSILELAGGKRNEMREAGSFQREIDRIKAIQGGAPPAGKRWNQPGLDRYTRLRRQELIAVGAAPSMGKTWFLVDSAVRLARDGTPVFVFSAETGEESLRIRILANVAQVDSRKLAMDPEAGTLTSAEMERIEQASAELATLPLYLDFTSLSADDVLAQMEATVLRKRIPLKGHYVMMFDYLQFGSKLVGVDENTREQISRLSTEFKFTAKITDWTVGVFSQLRREAEGNRTPDMTWWKESGRIEQDQDLGIIVVGERVEGGPAPREMWVVKQREGLANMAIPFTLDQRTGLWKWVHDDHPVERKPLILTMEG